MLCNSTVWHDISWAGHRVGVPARSPLSLNNPTPTLQQLHQKALNPWDAHSPSLFKFSLSATRLLSSLCCSAAAAGLLLGPTKNNGIATGNGDDDELGGDEKRRGFILLSDLEWLTAGRRFWCVCACERGLCCWESWAEVKQWIAEQEVCGQEVNLRDYLDSDQAAVFPPEATQRPAAASTGFILHVGTNPRSKSWNSSWSKCVLV